MAERCGQCPVLRSEVARLSGQVARLETLTAFIRRTLAELIGGVAATARHIDAEIQQPTVPPRTLLIGLHTRLELLLHRVEGK
jgi:hypothetical protein